MFNKVEKKIHETMCGEEKLTRMFSQVIVIIFKSDIIKLVFFSFYFIEIYSHLGKKNFFLVTLFSVTVNILILNHNHDTNRFTHCNSKTITTKSLEDRKIWGEFGLSVFLLLPSFHINVQRAFM